MAISRPGSSAIWCGRGRRTMATPPTLADRARAREPVANPRVVYQGEPGCYSEEAAAGFFGDSVDSKGLPWFNDVFAALEAGQADYAVVPVENSSTGSIRQVYDLMAQYRYFHCGGVAGEGGALPHGPAGGWNSLISKPSTPMNRA